MAGPISEITQENFAQLLDVIDQLGGVAAAKTTLFPPPPEPPCQDAKQFPKQVPATLKVNHLRVSFMTWWKAAKVTVITKDNHIGEGVGKIIQQTLEFFGILSADGVLGYISWEVLESKPNDFYVTVKVTNVEGKEWVTVCFFIDNTNVATFEGAATGITPHNSGGKVDIAGKGFIWKGVLHHRHKAEDEN
ncbi:hypothetical protein BDZ45DRAFT_691953 [Acephala macrosclerotiorum]|nr:hypothetical protein BDZ45DRAFT_691953 [Acephala macrosclerotiorum]